MTLPLNHSISEIGCAPVGSSFVATRGLPANEVRRRIWHMLPGLLPFLLAGLPRAEVEQHLWFYQLIIATEAIGLSALACFAYSIIARQGEQHSMINAATYGAVPLGILLVFPRQPQFAAVSLVVLALGDGSATLFGRLWGMQTLPWNHHKSWVGLVAFIVCAGPAAIMAYWLHAVPSVPFTTAVWCGAIPTLIAAGVESLSSYCCENLRISGTAAIALMICSVLIAG